MRQNTNVEVRTQVITQPLITPEPVRTYLTDNGWQTYYVNEGEYFTRTGESGIFSYSEAVAYMMVKYFTLQGK